jgi:hypothetical protein
VFVAKAEVAVEMETKQKNNEKLEFFRPTML